MYNFCTLFDSNYLTRGLALYDSLRAMGESFKLYVVCFDAHAHHILKRLDFPDLILIKLEDFESEDLLKVKSERTAAEYCWTCTSHVIRYVLDTYNLPEMTYLDADLFFFAKPSILFEEFYRSDASVMITEHRYTPKYDMSKVSGIYCVQFMTFKADTRGLQVLQWWQERCIEWCYARFEDGKFGDQKYLDDWPERFEGIHVLQHSGGGVAPWNVQQYKVSFGPRVNALPIVFYHFHALRWYEDGRIDLGGFKIPEYVVKFVYEPYFQIHQKQFDLVRTIEPSFNKGKDPYDKSWNALRNLKRRIMGTYHVIKR